MSDEKQVFILDENQTLDTMLHQILNHALVAIGATAGSLMLVDEDQGILQIKARLGTPRKHRKSEPVFQIGDGIAGRVVRTLKSHNCSDINEDSTFKATRSDIGFKSVLSVPIVYKGRAIAVINADADGINNFTTENIQTLERVAASVAGPIAKKMSVIDALLVVGKDLARLPREGGVEIVLKKIADAAVKSLGADIVTLYQYDESRDEYLVEGTGPTISGKLIDDRPMRTKVYPGDVPFTVVRSRKSGFYSDVKDFTFLTGEVERPGSEPRPRFVEREGIQSMAALLLPYGPTQSSDEDQEEIVGVMFANYRAKHDFNIDERKALATFADFAAVAILNARNEERRIREGVDLVNAITGSLAHRMGRLFGASRLAVELLRERIPHSDNESQEHLDLIYRQADLLFGLARRLTERIKAGEPAVIDSIDLHEVVSAALDSFDRDLGKGGNISLDNQVGQDLRRVASDRVHLQQAINDLVRNAIESIREKIHSCKKERVNFQGFLSLKPRFNQDRQTIDLEITDNGVGIDAEKAEEIFLPGVTTKETLGIGLWWCRAFIEGTGGEIVLKHTIKNEGCTFLLRIPVFSHNTTETMSRRTKPNELTALIVEDDMAYAKIFNQLITKMGFRVEIASSFAAAKQKLSKYYYDLISLDVSLYPGSTLDSAGLDLLPILQRQQRQALTKVVVVTAHEVRAEALREKYPFIVGCFDKGNVTLAKLRDAIFTESAPRARQLD